MENQNDKDKRYTGLPCDGSKDRQRLYFVADSLRGGASYRPGEGLGAKETSDGKDGGVPGQRLRIGEQGPARLLADAAGIRLNEREHSRGLEGKAETQSENEQIVISDRFMRNGPARLLADAEECRSGTGLCDSGPGAERGIQPADRGELGDTDSPSPSRLGEDGGQGEAQGRLRCGPCNGFWSDSVWLPCRDGKARPTKPGIFPLVDGATKRVGHCGDTGLEVNATPEARVLRLRGYGDAIVAPVAAEFIMAYCSCEQKLCVMRGSEEDDDA